MKLSANSGHVIRRSATSEDRTLRAVLSTGVIARDGHVVDPEGWIIPSSGTVPLVDSHRDLEQGITSILGRVSNIRVASATLEDGETAPALLGKLVFAERDVNPAAEVAFQLYANGFADAVSVSFIPRDFSYANSRDRAPGALNIRSAELLEVSTVAVPSDVNATVLRALRAHSAGRRLTRSDREALAAFHLERIRADDAAHETVEDRRARAAALLARRP